MRVCVDKTGKLIEMQSDATEGTLLMNAVNGGYALSDIEERVVTEAEYAALLAAQPKSAAEIKAELMQIVQNHLDAQAQAHGYDNIFTACTYAEETSVPQFQAEGKAFRAWRSLVWQYCYAQMDAVGNGQRSVPTATELMTELPTLVL